MLYRRNADNLQGSSVIEVAYRPIPAVAVAANMRGMLEASAATAAGQHESDGTIGGLLGSSAGLGGVLSNRCLLGQLAYVCQPSRAADSPALPHLLHMQRSVGGAIVFCDGPAAQVWNYMV